MQKLYLISLYIALGFITLFVILTKGQPLLMKRKVMIGMLILSLTAPAVTLVSCKSGNQVTASKDIWQSEGWIDRDTFRIMATGNPRKGLTSDAQKKGTAREAAVLIAQIRILEKFNGDKIESCGGFSDYEQSHVTALKEYNAIIKNGVVIAEKYDDQFNCDIIYEVKYPGLKKKVSGYVID